MLYHVRQGLLHDAVQPEANATRDLRACEGLQLRDFGGDRQLDRDPALEIVSQGPDACGQSDFDNGGM